MLVWKAFPNTITSAVSHIGKLSSAEICLQSFRGSCVWYSFVSGDEESCLGIRKLQWHLLLTNIIQYFSEIIKGSERFQKTILIVQPTLPYWSITSYIILFLNRMLKVQFTSYTVRLSSRKMLMNSMLNVLFFYVVVVEELDIVLSDTATTFLFWKFAYWPTNNKTQPPLYSFPTLVLAPGS